MKQTTALLLAMGILCALTTQAAPTSALHPTGKPTVIGNLTSCTIVIPKEATAQEKYSAGLLGEYLGKIFGLQLPVIQEPSKAPGKIISVGDTAAASAANIKPDPREQAYRLAVDKGNLYILGGTRGPLYGVIALLEEDLGCRWYATTDKPVIPTLAPTQFAVVQRTYSPPFEVRELLYEAAFNNDWAAFNRLQPVSYFFRIPAEKGGGLANSNYFIHTYDQLVPAKAYFDTHPEYFPLRDGKRFPSTQNDGQLCYTSAGVVDVIVAQLDAEIAKNPGTYIYSVSANDNVYSNCECPSCQAIIKSEDGLPGAQLYLANAVANRLAVKYPQIKISTLAYVNSQIPTKTIKPGPNTVIFYAPIRLRGNAISMLLPLGDLNDIDTELSGWHKIASHIYLWDYVDRVGPTALPDFEALDRGWPFLLKNGVSGVFMEGQLQGRTSLAELKVWLYTKKLWNPNWSQKELIGEFLNAYYGPAAAEMTAYYTLQLQRWESWYRDRKPGERLTFSGDEKGKMHELLSAALKRCDGKPDYQAKVELEMLSWTTLMLSTYPTTATAARYGEYLNQASALITKLGVKYTAESVTSEVGLKRWSDQLKKVTEKQGLPQYSANSITVKEPQCPVAQYLPAADATQGVAARQSGFNSDWGVQWLYDDFIDQLQPGKPYVVRMRVKPEFKTAPAQAGAMFGLGHYGFGIGGGGLYTGSYDANDKGQYRWVNLFRVQVETPGMTGYFYCVPGAGMTKDDAIWYDYLELIPESEYQDKEASGKLPLVKL
ncbi:MAG: DUF4838 domain-containing protein [Armatimonadota bacterium]